MKEIFKWLLKQRRLILLRRSLRKEFPKLYELYSESRRGSADNYFEHPNCINAVVRRDEQLYSIESNLQQMDPTAWQAFKAKTIRAVAIVDRWGWNSELFDRFDEARAYSYLREEGYSNIEFIPESPKARTPDLWANRHDGAVLLEVKTIRESDDENNYMTRREKYEREKDVREVTYSLNDAVKGKLEKTVQGAAEQLRYRNKVANRRILFMSIQLDLSCATERTLKVLSEFLKDIQPRDVEIIHVVKNTLFL